ncbi:MAG: FKBP-type peptidyl-prolyl cis-trans isomerase [Vicinamibacteria bacterium]|nr:FKBP-type peptidyl-prolyl cis-trans isomerase [Vicinamibacteria bacterium]
MTDDEKTFYTLGFLLGGNLRQFHLSQSELERVEQGLKAAANGAEPGLEIAEYRKKVEELANQRMTAAAEKEKQGAKGFEEAAAKEPGAVRMPSGLVFRSLSPGNGAKPAADAVVKVHYEGTLTNGTVFDSSIKRGEPVEFPLGRVIPCWTEGLQQMKVGEKAKLVCPSSIAYGDQGRPPSVPGGATLVFEVQLLEIKAAPTSR